MKYFRGQEAGFNCGGCGRSSRKERGNANLRHARLTTGFRLVNWGCPSVLQSPLMRYPRLSLERSESF